jgi:hypothetical protein
MGKNEQISMAERMGASHEPNDHFLITLHGNLPFGSWARSLSSSRVSAVTHRSLINGKTI